jgi:hypothetical protein
VTAWLVTAANFGKTEIHTIKNTREKKITAKAQGSILFLFAKVY